MAQRQVPWLVGGLLAIVWAAGWGPAPGVGEARSRGGSAQAAARPPAASQQTAEELRWRAFRLLRAGRPQDAIELFNRVLADSPADADALFGKAAALARTGRRAEAAAAVRQAFESGFDMPISLTRDPDIKGLRGEGAYDALVRQLAPVLAEEEAPSVLNVKRLFDDPRFERYLLRRLPRYRSSELTGRTLDLLGRGDPPAQRAAVIALLHQNANDAATRTRVAALLSSPSADVREAAAEYFLWHGRTEDRDVLAGAAAVEADVFALAAQNAALDLIAKRAGWAGLTTSQSPASPVPKEATCREALAALRARPSIDAFRRAGEVFRWGWDVEPTLVFRGMDHDASALTEQRACFTLAASLFRFMDAPGGAAPGRVAALPTARSFSAPLRDYFDRARRSFGVRTGSAGPFAESVHVGDDVAGFADDRTVVAIGDGVVRRATYTYSWGFIVIIEHQLPKREGSYCSLYAHLAPSISVAVGQIVRKGQRIAALGRSNTWESGGYLAHLHFGIHRGPFLQFKPSALANSSLGDGSLPGMMGAPPSSQADASWITGYLAPGRWDDGDHGWVDPQRFLTDRR